MEQENKQMMEIFDRTTRIAEERYEGVRKGYFDRLMGDVVIKLADINKDSVLLDVGAGVGWFIGLVSERVRSGVGIDFSKERTKSAYTTYKNKGDFCAMDAQRLGFKNESFTVAVSIGMFANIEDIKPYLEEMWRVLMPGGNVVFTCANENYIFGFFLRLLGRIKKEDTLSISKNYGIKQLKKDVHVSGFKLDNWTSTYYIPFLGISYLPSPITKIYVDFIVLLNLVLTKITKGSGETIILCCTKRSGAKNE